MSITKLQITHFRNFLDLALEPSPRINIFYGQNGAGKTSLLEAIYYLGMAKSFRTQNADRIINHDHHTLTVAASLDRTTVGIERKKNGSKRIKLNGKNVNSLAEIAKILPMKLLSTESHRYFCDGPKVRRQFMDWGLFHVEPSFFRQWQMLQATLKQRNACLKTAKNPFQETKAWDIELSGVAEYMDTQRKAYIERLNPHLSNILNQLLGIPLELRYTRGWKEEHTLFDYLREQLPLDMQFGYTRYGPHRADAMLYHKNIPAHDYLSQGQQKLAAYALHLAQGLVLSEITHNSPIYLVDDLPSELDPERRHYIAECLINLNGQLFVTGIVKEDLSDFLNHETTSVFHVKHGVAHPEHHNHRMNN